MHFVKLSYAVAIIFSLLTVVHPSINHTLTISWPALCIHLPPPSCCAMLCVCQSLVQIASVIAGSGHRPIPLMPTHMYMHLHTPYASWPVKEMVATHTALPCMVLALSSKTGLSGNNLLTCLFRKAGAHLNVCADD